MEKHHPPPQDHLDTLFTCLADSHRRLVIRALSDEATPLPLERLTRRIAERGATVSGVDQREIAIALYHKHLPKLVEAGIISVDDGRHTVDKGESFDVAESLLDDASSR